MTISVIIPTYNSKRTLGNCVKSILNQSVQASEIIVVDNASTDKTAPYIEEKFPTVKVVRMDRNTGVTGGRNQGIKIASKKSQFLMFFDHDMIADKNMLRNLISQAQKGKKIGIVTPKIYYLSDKKRIWSAGTGMNLWTGQVLFRGGEDQGQYEKVEEVQVAPAAMLVRREVINKISGFDDNYYAVYEDTDFCFRAKKRGYKTVYAPDALAFHDLSTSKIDEANRLLSRGYWVGRNRVIFMKTWGRSYFVFLLFLPIYLLYYLKLAIKYNHIEGIFAFARGTLAGIFGDGFELPFSYVWAHKRAFEITDTILDLGCGDGQFLSDLVVGKTIQAWGVDLHKETINKALNRGLYAKVLQGDVVEVSANLVDQRRKFDTVICSQLLEHVTKKEGFELLTSMDKLAKKTIIVGTPRGFMNQPKEYYRGNPLQEHKSGWSINDFTKLGYKVRGVGFYPLWTENGPARSSVRMVSIGARILSVLLSPLVYYIPSIASGLVCIKQK